MRNETAAEIDTLCCLRASTTPRLLPQPLLCRVCHFQTIIHIQSCDEENKNCSSSSSFFIFFTRSNSL